MKAKTKSGLVFLGIWSVGLVVFCLGIKERFYPAMMTGMLVLVMMPFALVVDKYGDRFTDWMNKDD